MKDGLRTDQRLKPSNGMVGHSGDVQEELQSTTGSGDWACWAEVLAILREMRQELNTQRLELEAPMAHRDFLAQFAMPMSSETG